MSTAVAASSPSASVGATSPTPSPELPTPTVVVASSSSSSPVPEKSTTSSHSGRISPSAVSSSAASSAANASASAASAPATARAASPTSSSSSEESNSRVPSPTPSQQAAIIAMHAAEVAEAKSAAAAAAASGVPPSSSSGLLSLLGLTNPTPPLIPPQSYAFDGGVYTGLIAAPPGRKPTPPTAAAAAAAAAAAVTAASASAAPSSSSDASSSPVSPPPIVPHVIAEVPHGRGKLRLPNGIEVSGEWHYGVLSVGILTNPSLPDALHYEGELFHYMRNGKGIEWRLEDGEINRWGKWDKNVLIAECPVPRSVLPEGAFLAQEDLVSQLEFIMADGTAARYEGSRNAFGEPHGTGTMINAKNEAVRGHSWIDGAQDGEGFFVHVDGEKYSGSFKHGFKHGYGAHSFPDGEAYEGQFRMNRKHGIGRMRWDDGYIYEGLWAHDEQNGSGIEYTRAGKISACGRWKDSELKEWHAIPRSVIPVGTYLSEKAKVGNEQIKEAAKNVSLEDYVFASADLLYSDGGYYRGEVNSAHEAHGKGILYTASNGIVQGGLFQFGKLHGEGFTNHPDGGRYVGEHRAGLREGFGKLSLANGDKYVGAFHNNLQHGRGVYTWSKGDVYDGTWADVRMHGIGKYSWPDGIVYLGEWVLGLQTGLGFKWSGLGTRPQFGRWLDNKLIQSLWVAPAVLAKMPSWSVEEFKAELEGKWAEMARTSALQTAKIVRPPTAKKSTLCTCTCKTKPCTGQCACTCASCTAARVRSVPICAIHPTSSSLAPADEWSGEVYDLIVKMRAAMEPHQFAVPGKQSSTAGQKA